VASEVAVRKPPSIDLFIECLQREGFMKKVIEPNGNEMLRPLTSYLGTGVAPTQVSASHPKDLWNAYHNSERKKFPTRNEFLNYYGRYLVTALFLHNRLTSLNVTNTYDHLSSPPQNDLQALYVDDTAKDQLLTEARASFAKSVWPDSTRGNVLCLKVSDDSQRPSPQERHSPKTMDEYRTIENEGDGLKSYMATCIALILGRRPLCVVDEPEMCLHPPQAYNLGRFIGLHGSSPDRVTFVSTHSSHVLRGVIQSTAELQIVRLTRRNQAFKAHLVSAEELKAILERPTIRAETVLDGIFAEAVVVLEADGDRMVYQAVYESLNSDFRFDIHFTAVGGTGGIADTCRLYRRLRIPIAVIADLDLLVDTDRLHRILSELAQKERVDGLVRMASGVANAIKNIPPTLSAEDVRGQLESAAALGMDWGKHEDKAVRDALVDIAQGLDRMRRLKQRGGIASLPPDLALEVKALQESLSEIGVFVVPVGELEGWMAEKGIKSSKRSKWAWAIEAAELVRRVGVQGGDVWEFIRAVASHLSREPA
jgi:hypothetical protein